MKTRITLLTLAAASLSALAADITGTWKAEFETQRGLQKYTFNFKQDGTTVTGKASVEMTDQKRDAEFKDGKVEGDTMTFVEPLKIQDNEINITYTGRISGNEIKFTRKVGDFGFSEATAKREDGAPQAAPGQRGPTSFARQTVRWRGSARSGSCSTRFTSTTSRCVRSTADTATGPRSCITCLPKREG
jgi:hypothetical protein